MASEPIPSADKISAEDFSAYLAKYKSCIRAISNSRGTKAGDKGLVELDKYRYEEAVADFSGDEPRKQMGLEDVKTLVNWKLRHGKFRPTLMKLVSSNDADFVKVTVQEALECYKEKSDVSAALDILVKLKGIGPATASLLLAVLDPERVIFFADEAFYWLCCSGKKSPIKYNAKEYKELTERARSLCKRLNVRAVDIERVAFVIMKQQDADLPTDKVKKEKEITPPNTTTGRAEKTAGPVKRKASSDEKPETAHLDSAPERRSKRIQRAKQA